MQETKYQNIFLVLVSISEVRCFAEEKKKGR